MRQHTFRHRTLPWLLFGVALLLVVALTPRLLRDESALQIRVSSQGVTLPDGFYVYQRLNAQGIQIKSITPSGDTLVIHFDSSEESQAAQKALHEIFPYGFVIAQIESGADRHWLSKIRFHSLWVG
ncbi:EnvZ/OmpR regulon moderator MzrA [Paramixta manurensis]|uniref:Modulator protein MzrA n=1 Tax=Paramixta manurensis TaxID=2740817 RepID=A0A6M8UJZ2_9GAMM|nr:EnvZ/OmpR regulon moderator MzrA [Erwiniaceae bacterium PD-1]